MTVGKVQKIINKAMIRHAKSADQELGTKHYQRVTFKNLARIVTDFKGVAFRIGDLLTDTGLAEFGQQRDAYWVQYLTLRTVVKVTPKTVTTVKCVDWCFAKRKNEPLPFYHFQKHKIKFEDATPFVTENNGSYKCRPLNYVFKKIPEPTKEVLADWNRRCLNKL